jgi:hypothetical protein
MAERETLIRNARSLRSFDGEINLSKSTNSEISTFIKKKKAETIVNRLPILKYICQDRVNLEIMLSRIKNEDEVLREGEILQINSSFLCPICQEEEKSVHLKFPCGHEFHWLCFFKCQSMLWKHKCAVCRQTMIPVGEVKLEEQYANCINLVMDL